MYNSTFDTNPLKETESLELERRLLTSVNIQFDYYSITCRDIQKTPNAIHSIYRGNANRPNIILNNNQYFPTYYQTTELSIYSNLHIGTHQAELIIKHTPISGSIVPIYVCFFLYSESPPSSGSPKKPDLQVTATKQEHSIVKSINSIVEFAEPLDIDISPLLAPSVFTNEINKEVPITWQVYETVNGKGKCMVVLIDKPLYINQTVINQIPKNTILPFKVSTIVTKPSQSIETFVTVTGTDNTKNGFALSKETDNVMTCDMIPDGEYGDINVVQMPLQVGKDKTDSLYILTIIIYICVSITIFAIEFVGSPLIFNIIIKKIANINDNNTSNNNFIILLLLAGWFSIFTSITIICILVGVLGKSTNILLVAIGVFFGFSTLITTTGICVLSSYVNNNQIFDYIKEKIKFTSKPENS
jgi:hypothetical protein